MYEMEPPDVPAPGKCEGCGNVIEMSLQSFPTRALRWSPYLCPKCNQAIDDYFRATAV